MIRIASPGPGNGWRQTIRSGSPISWRVGVRSAMATQAFRASGYEAYSMAGGLMAWADAGLPLAPEGGRVADH